MDEQPLIYIWHIHGRDRSQLRGITANIARIKLTIQDLTYPNTYWKGSAWGVDASTLNPTAAGSIAGPAVEWYRSGVNWISDRVYRVRYWAEDDLANEANPQSYDVTFDTTPPQVGITSPLNLDKLGATPVISGTADGALSGLSDVRIDVSSQSAGGWSTVYANQQQITYIPVPGPGQRLEVL